MMKNQMFFFADILHRRPCRKVLDPGPAKKRRTFKQWLQLKYMQYNVTRYTSSPQLIFMYVHIMPGPLCTATSASSL